MGYQRGGAVLSGGGSAAAKPRLLDEVRRRLRLKHYSLRTERIYVGWIRAFIRFSDRRHPSTLGGPEVGAFPKHGSGFARHAPALHFNRAAQASAFPRCSAAATVATRTWVRSWTPPPARQPASPAHARARAA
ncbi:MAG: phage integrase N-terminal SAM-like domain-containing protein [Xanthomonadales bacterium]|nr:phage integrase N-terminal SAM-like domain-containing protein [Xanthomonadales bacterium]